jgi:hypothetical protein
MIDFDNIRRTNHLPHEGWERLREMPDVHDGINKILKATLDPGCSIGYHVHS